MSNLRFSATVSLLMSQTYPILKLKPGREPHLKNRHHAIFQTAVSQYPSCEDGSIVEVQDSTGAFLCYATLNRKAYIVGRAIAFEKRDPLEQLEQQIKNAVTLRKQFFSHSDTTAFRLVNAEGDAVPGIIADLYGSVLVLQLTTLGMDKLRPWVTEVMRKYVTCDAIYEKSAGPGRKKEGLEPVEGWIGKAGKDTVEVMERGIKFLISLSGSQKTGLFLDQREMRSLVRSLSKGRTVLDCCSYVGGFSVSALKGGAVAADAVDYDKVAIDRAREHVKLNGAQATSFNGYAEDVFQFLRRCKLPREYDFVILDPPAFAKRSTDLDRAKHAYTDLNRLGMEVLKNGGFLLTCSCSYQVDISLFQTIIFHAAQQSKKRVRILDRHRQALDHPVNIFHPEADYLKSLLLWVD